MVTYQKETAPVVQGRFDTSKIHAGKSRFNYITAVSNRKVFTSANYLRHVGELYREAKFISRDGLKRGFQAGDVLEAVTHWTLCSRNGLDALDAWQAAMDAHRAALVETRE